MRFDMIERNKDMISENEDMELLYTMKNFPIYMGVTNELLDKDLFADEKWVISNSSGMIQLKELVPAEILYAKSHNSSIGKVWERHHSGFAAFLHRHIGKNGILEIGGGNGILNKIYRKTYSDVLWKIIEPTTVEAIQGCNAEYIRGFWKAGIDFSKINKNYDTLVHSHLIEHQYDLKEFMKLNNLALDVGEKMIFTMPNMMELLLRKYPYALNFEHTYFISEDYVEPILKKYGFAVVDKEYFEDHSIFYCAEKIREAEDDLNEDLFQDKKFVEELKKKNTMMFKDYVAYYEKLTHRLNDVLRRYKGKKYVFGAHINTQLLINFGLNVREVEAVLDNDPLKQGHRLYGTKLMVNSPRILEKEDNPLVILIMGAYNKEIRENIIENINDSVQFIE